MNGFPKVVRIAESIMILDDTLTAQDLEDTIEVNFGAREEVWESKGGSPWSKWYRQIASGKAEERPIAWKEGKPFDTESVFFRSLDTGRLLPMEGGAFRMQYYAHQSHWDHLDHLQGRRTHTIQATLSMLHEVLLLRNMYDMGCSDVPVIFNDWTAERIDMAMEFWVSLSKKELPTAARERRYAELVAEMRVDNNRPCFPQMDILVRSLLTDPAVDYVPPFIIFYSTKENRGQVLFIYAHYRPSPALLWRTRMSQ